MSRNKGGCSPHTFISSVVLCLLFVCLWQIIALISACSHLNCSFADKFCSYNVSRTFVLLLLKQALKLFVMPFFFGAKSSLHNTAFHQLLCTRTSLSQSASQPVSLPASQLCSLLSVTVLKRRGTLQFLVNFIFVIFPLCWLFVFLVTPNC